MDLCVPGLALKNPTQKKNTQKVKTRKKPQPIVFFLGGGGVISFALNMYFPPIMLT